MNDLNSVVARVTERIALRSQDSRARYLALMEREGDRHGGREFLSCSNLAHGFAAALEESRASVSEAMEREYEAMQGELKRRAMEVRPIGFLTEGMVESTRASKH